LPLSLADITLGKHERRHLPEKLVIRQPQVFVRIGGKQHYLWRAVDQDGEVVDGYLQARRDGTVAKQFLKRRVRERGMQNFKSVQQAQRFLGGHAEVYNLFNLGRHLVSANHYRNLRVNAFKEWSLAVT